jgi:protein disulfide-isomerase A6
VRRQLDGKVKVGAINCDEEKDLCGQAGIQGFPTIKFFGKRKSSPLAYEGGRDAASLTSYALKHWSKSAPPPEVRLSAMVSHFEVRTSHIS